MNFIALRSSMQLYDRTFLAISFTKKKKSFDQTLLHNQNVRDWCYNIISGHGLNLQRTDG